MKKIYFLISALLIGLVVGNFHVNSLEPVQSKGLLFVTVGLDQSKLIGENSSYEIQRASEHFSDLLLGWTLDPAFDSELDQIAGYDLTLTGQRQEKQNLLFYISANPEYYSLESHKYVLELLNARIEKYDLATNSGFLIAFSTYSDLESKRDDFRIILGIALVFFITGLGFIECLPYAKTYCRRFKALT